MTLSNWIPYKLVSTDHCRWLYTGNKAFTEPFFDDTISKCKSLAPYRQHSVSNLLMLPEWAANIKSIRPSAFIFHISRCGSTLLSQLLGINEQHIILSEVPFIDEILRAPYKKQPVEILSPSELLEAALRFYGQVRTGNEKQLFIKTDSWHVFFYKTIRQLYPGVPFILLYRKPQEVIRSHQQRRGMQAVPGVIEPEIFGFEKAAVTDLDQYIARVIERYLEVFTEIIENDERCLLVNYNQGMLNAVEQVAAFTGTGISAEDREKMEARTRYHAKYPDQAFREHAAELNTPAYLQKCIELYERLEEKRMLSVQA